MRDTPDGRLIDGHANSLKVLSKIKPEPIASDAFAGQCGGLAESPEKEMDWR
jgi:hypothetical protein